MTASRPTVAVLGAGALGLLVALRLAERGHPVTVLEREPLAGGLAAGFEIEPGMWLEKFYHHLFRSDRNALRVIEEVGLRDRVTWSHPDTVVLHKGRLHPLDSPASLLRFTPLSAVDRLRMGVVLAWLMALPASRFEGQRAAEWLRRTMGEAGFKTVWQPLLRSKFGAVAEEIALPWFWARVHDRTAQLGYLRGGFQLLYQGLADRVRASGGELRFGAEVRQVTRARNGLRLASSQGGRDLDETYSTVVSTLATRLTCRLAPELPGEYRDRFAWGTAYGAHCLILALDRQLTDAYWINVNDPGFPFMAAVEHTNYRPPAEYGGRHLVYLGNYRPMEDALYAATKADVVAAYTPHLARLNPAFDESWVRESWMFAAPFAQPIVTVDYRNHIPPFKTPVPGLFVANMFQVYPHDRGQNYSFALAERLIEEVFAA